MLSATKGTGFRLDIQALRALAVSLVVIGHLWPNSLTGGYVGVDVFFVISGFLITTHLSKEIIAAGRLDFAAFYTRRIRRLLPAAFLVLTASLVASLFVLPFSRWGDTAQQIVASALYIENWVLAANSVDYSASTATATVAQHFWSLSVEEQFYLVWPLLLVALAVLAGRAGLGRRVVLAAGVLLLSGASFAYSAHLAEVGRHEAYFYTPVRLWEFGIGATLALVAPHVRLPSLAANSASLAGFAGVFASAIIYNAQTPFPGTAALLPVAGTALVIAGGLRGGRQWHSAVTSLPPVQFLGNISYSLYLWHWPLVVFGPFLFNAELRTPYKTVLLVASVVLAWVTKTWVEDKGIKFRPRSRPVLRTITAMVVGMVVIAGACGGLWLGQQSRVAEAQQIMLKQKASPCYGPLAMERPSDCADRFGPALVPTMSDANNYYSTPPECGDHKDILIAGGKKTTKFCDFSGGAPKPTTVWLIGDSHAQQWQAAILELAKRNNWLLKMSYLGGCPPADVSYVGYGARGDEKSNSECRSWGRSVSDAVAKDSPKYVFTSAFARKELVDDGSGRPQAQQYAEGFGKYWSTWMANGSRVVVLADPPYNVDVRSPNCVLLNANNPIRCAVERRLAAPEDPLVEAAKVNQNNLLTLVDLTDYFCDARSCYSAVGGVVVYYDANHLNVEFSRLLTPMIEGRL
jgi:peptidoglycan/LPS O-acetylase OafA/YrhL